MFARRLDGQVISVVLLDPVTGDPIGTASIPLKVDIQDAVLSVDEVRVAGGTIGISGTVPVSFPSGVDVSDEPTRQLGETRVSGGTITAITDTVPVSFAGGVDVTDEATRQLGTVSVDGGTIVIRSSGGTNINPAQLNKQEEIIAHLAAVRTALELIDNVISGSEAQVDVVAPLPAGTNTLGTVNTGTMYARERLADSFASTPASDGLMAEVSGVWKLCPWTNISREFNSGAGTQVLSAPGSGYKWRVHSVWALSAATAGSVVLRTSSAAQASVAGPNRTMVIHTDTKDEKGAPFALGGVMDGLENEAVVADVYTAAHGLTVEATKVPTA